MLRTPGSRLLLTAWLALAAEQDIAPIPVDVQVLLWLAGATPLPPPLGEVTVMVAGCSWALMPVTFCPPRCLPWRSSGR